DPLGLGALLLVNGARLLEAGPTNGAREPLRRHAAERAVAPDPFTSLYGLIARIKLLPERTPGPVRAVRTRTHVVGVDDADGLLVHIARLIDHHLRKAAELLLDAIVEAAAQLDVARRVLLERLIAEEKPGVDGVDDEGGHR